MIRAVLRIAFRDFTRRPLQTLLVVGGLLVASLVMSAALVAGDAMEALFLENTYRAWGTVDMAMGTVSGTPFPESVGRAVAEDPSVKEASDGYSMHLISRGSVENTRNKSRERSVRVVGMDPVSDAALGKFTAEDGRPIDTLKGKRVAINQRLARRLDAKEGDALRVLITGLDAKAVSLDLEVGSILRNEGKADAGRAASVFLDLSHMQQALGAPGAANSLRLSAPGGVRDPSDAEKLALRANLAAKRVARASPGTGVLSVVDSKVDDIRSSREQSKFFRAILGMLGAIVALASIALIANLFVMLGEERRGEQGALRALGLKRSGLILLGISEGILYSASAAVIGSVLGSFFGRYLAKTMGDLFKSFTVDGSFDLATPPFSAEPSTLITAGLVGFAVTMVSVVFVTLRTSRLTVIAAIRGLPDVQRRSHRKIPVAPILSLVLGALSLASGLANEEAEIAILLGGTLLIVGISSLVSRYAAKRLGSTLGGIAGFGWGLWSNAFLPDFDRDPNYAFALVTLTGVITVGAGVILVAANVGSLRVLATGLGSRVRAVVRTATAYAAGYRFRTAMSMAMFGLVVYMIAAFAVWGGFGGGSDVEKLSGGYDVYADSTVPLEEFEVESATEISSLFSAVYSRGYRVGSSQEVHFPIRFSGIDEDFAQTNRFTLGEKEKGTDSEHWDRLADSKDLAIIDQAANPGSAKAGDKLVVKTDRGTRTFTVIGIADEFLFNSIYVSKQAFTEMFPTRAGNTFWLVRAEGHAASAVAREIERKYGDRGVDAQPIKEIFEERSRAQRTFVGLFQLLLKLGLVIGISGLAIGAVRTVLERRQAIGILRAMGFQSRMVGAWLLIETVLIATLGVVVGLGVGLVGTFLLVEQQIEGFSFTVDWSQIRSALVIIYGATLLFTALPVWKASRMRPSEAVRYVE